MRAKILSFSVTAAVVAVLLASPTAAAERPLRIFACEPEWAALAEELAGPKAKIDAGTTAQQDPHHIQARPSLIGEVRRADLVVCTGAQLEIGWLPLLLRRASNPAVQEGSKGHFLAADHVRKLDVPQQITRAKGDIHPAGNPHIHLDPRNIRIISEKLAERLGRLDPANASFYADNQQRFEDRWEGLIDDWEERAEALEDMRLVSHHKAFTYLANWLELDIVDHLEPKPGIPPTSSHLSNLLSDLGPNPPKAIVRTPYADPQPSRWLSSRLQVPQTVLPFTIGGADGADDLAGLFETTIGRLAELNE